MIKYHRLQRNPIDDYAHWLAYSFYALSPTILPITTEGRAILAVALFILLNLCKFLFRPDENVPKTIEQYLNCPNFPPFYRPRLIKDHQEAYPEPDKIAIITGATSGIGKEMAKAISKAGFTLFLRKKPYICRVL